MNQPSLDIQCMREALRLAEQARGNTSPNPMVGAVIVKDGKIIGAGYHHQAGQPHAEIEALRAVTEDPHGATIYVTLEPCCMYGKTPPCADALIQHGIRRVVAAMIDPDRRVRGKGIEQIRAAGIDVEVGLCENEARRLNEAFIKHAETGLPFVIAKFAMSLDGKIATKTGASKYLTNAMSRAYVHRLRREVDAILVGIGTVRADNPLLTTRLPECIDTPCKPPRRILLDTHLSVPITAHIVQDTSIAPTTIFVGDKYDQQKAAQLKQRGVIIHKAACHKDGRLDLHDVLAQLGEQKILSVLIEGGAEIHGAIFASGLADKVLAFIAPMIIGGQAARSPVGGEGIAALDDAIRLEQVKIQQFGEDVFIEAYVHRDY